MSAISSKDNEYSSLYISSNYTPDTWKCSQCVKCKSCGTSRPGTKWNEDFTLCRSCERLIAQNFYCGICKKVLKFEDG